MWIYAAAYLPICICRCVCIPLVCAGQETEAYRSEQHTQNKAKSSIFIWWQEQQGHLRKNLPKRSREMLTLAGSAMKASVPKHKLRSGSCSVLREGGGWMRVRSERLRELKTRPMLKACGRTARLQTICGCVLGRSAAARRSGSCKAARRLSRTPAVRRPQPALLSVSFRLHRPIPGAVDFEAGAGSGSEGAWTHRCDSWSVSNSTWFRKSL